MKTVEIVTSMQFYDECLKTEKRLREVAAAIGINRITDVRFYEKGDDFVKNQITVEITGTTE